LAATISQVTGGSQGDHRTLGIATDHGHRVALSKRPVIEIVEDCRVFVGLRDVRTVPGIDLDDLGPKPADGLAAAPVRAKGPVPGSDNVSGRDGWSQRKRLLVESLGGEDP
jgi:hypothetical protein